LTASPNNFYRLQYERWAGHESGKFGRWGLFQFLPQEKSMLHYAIVFFVIALIAAVLGFTGIAASAAGIAKILFVVFIVMAIVAFIVNQARG
jgi:uncharacterized membrane protein YtjA (UPF0391 family)